MVAKTRMAVACVLCGRSVERTPSYIARTKLIHCSRECANANPRRLRRKAYLPCEWCMEMFYPDSHPNSSNRFCRKACKKQQMEAGLRVQRVRADKGVRKDGTVLVPCYRCGNAVTVPPHRQEQGHHYCSMECFHRLGAQLNGRRSGHLHRKTNTNGKAYQPRPSYREMETWDGVKSGYLTSEGYVRLRWPDHPSATKGGHIAAHRAVMEHLLGRQLHRGETVHHADGDRENNDASNLMLMVSDHPQGAAVDDLIRAYERRLQELRAASQMLHAAGAKTSMTQSRLFAPIPPTPVPA